MYSWLNEGFFCTVDILEMLFAYYFICSLFDLLHVSRF